MKMAIAVESMKHPMGRSSYKVWYLQLNKNKEVIKIDVVTKEELVTELLEDYRQQGRSKWRAFLKGHDRSSPIELTDFIAMNMHENTHFGNLPPLCEFQRLMDELKISLEISSIAS